MIIKNDRHDYSFTKKTFYFTLYQIHQLLQIISQSTIYTQLLEHSIRTILNTNKSFNIEIRKIQSEP